MPSMFLALASAVPVIAAAYRTGVINGVNADAGGGMAIPASTQAGDLMVFVSSGRYGAPVPPALTSGAWTAVGSNVSGGTSVMRVYKKIAAAGDAGQYMNFPSGAQWAISSISVFSGGPDYEVAATFAGGSGSTITAPAVTVPAAGIVLEAWGGEDVLNGGSITTPDTAILYTTFTHNTLATTQRTIDAARTASTNHPYNNGASIVLRSI